MNVHPYVLITGICATGVQVVRDFLLSRFASYFFFPPALALDLSSFPPAAAPPFTLGFSSFPPAAFGFSSFPPAAAALGSASPDDFAFLDLWQIVVRERRIC